MRCIISGHKWLKPGGVACARVVSKVRSRITRDVLLIQWGSTIFSDDQSIDYDPWEYCRYLDQYVYERLSLPDLRIFVVEYSCNVDDKLLFRGVSAVMYEKCINVTGGPFICLRGVGHQRGSLRFTILSTKCCQLSDPQVSKRHLSQIQSKLCLKVPHPCALNKRKTFSTSPAIPSTSFLSPSS